MAAAARDYSAEANELARLAKARCSDATSLLDVACGTGSHLRHLRAHFVEVAGIDISSRMLQRAQRELPDLRLELGDMRSFRLDRRFDVVTCLASSIGYLLTLDDGVEQFVEPHRMGLYSIDEYLAAFHTAGMAVEHHPSPDRFGRGLFIGQR